MNFASYHPVLNLLFFVAAVAFTACWTRPGLVAVSFLCALAFSVRLRGPRAVAFGGALVLCALAFAALFAMNVHFGVTNLARTPIGNSITVESLTCGVIVGLKVAAVLVWLSCALCVFTADKVVFLLGRVFPKAAMMLAVVLRAVPVAGDRARKIAVAQSGIGKGPGQGNTPRRIANALRRASILISWSIERFIEMSDSMRSRGSALRGRTAYSLYRFDNRDRACYRLSGAYHGVLRGDGARPDADALQPGHRGAEADFRKCCRLRRVSRVVPSAACPPNGRRGGVFPQGGKRVEGGVPKPV